MDKNVNWLPIKLAYTSLYLYACTLATVVMWQNDGIQVSLWQHTKGIPNKVVRLVT